MHITILIIVLVGLEGKGISVVVAVGGDHPPSHQCHNRLNQRKSTIAMEALSEILLRS